MSSRTRTISSNIRLKDGETNFLAGLYRTDKANNRNTIPFFGDIPILGRFFSRVSSEKHVTDLVLTLTPHIIRIPDVTEEDVTPYFVGTDSNISYQGGPRVENPTRDSGPFEQQPGAGGKMPPQPPQSRTAPPVANPGINLAPGSGPTDIFKPAPAPAAPPPGSPQAQVPPQGASVTTSSATVAAKSAAAEADAGTTPILFDFDPAYVALTAGAQQTVLVRATSAAGLPGGTVVIKFDPAVVAPVVVKAILGSGTGVADARIENGRVVIEFPGAEDLAGTRAVAEITLRGIAPGRSVLTFEPAELPGATVSSSQSVIDVK